MSNQYIVSHLRKIEDLLVRSKFLDEVKECLEVIEAEVEDMDANYKTLEDELNDEFETTLNEFVDYASHVYYLCDEEKKTKFVECVSNAKTANDLPTKDLDLV